MTENKAKKIINNAWDNFMYWAGVSRSIGKYNLERHMKADARDRSKPASKALIMSLGLHIYASNPPVSEIAHEESDIIAGGILAYRCIKLAESDGSQQDLEELILTATSSLEAHRDALRARIIEH